MAFFSIRSIARRWPSASSQPAGAVIVSRRRIRSKRRNRSTACARMTSKRLTSTGRDQQCPQLLQRVAVRGGDDNQWLNFRRHRYDPRTPKTRQTLAHGFEEAGQLAIDNRDKQLPTRA